MCGVDWSLDGEVRACCAMGSGVGLGWVARVGVWFR